MDVRDRSKARLFTVTVLGASILALAFHTFGAAQRRSPPAWKCRLGNGRPCDQSDLENPGLRQIVVLSAGYTETNARRFWRDFDLLIDRLGSRQSMKSWSVANRDKLLYIGYYTGGGPLGSSNAMFGARIMMDPFGTPTLGTQLEDVYGFIDKQQALTPSLRPLGAAVLFQSEDDVSPNTTPPSFSRRPYGVARFTSEQIQSGNYIPVHELAHAALNFLDEYVEDGLENLSIRQLDALSSSLMLGQLQHGNYDYNISEILAGNGPINLATRPDVTTVATPGATPQVYEYEGGLFFGKGTFHDAGNNLMNSNGAQRGEGNSFAYDHSGAQWQFINSVFGEAPYRANDRLKNAGPRDGWQSAESSVDLLLYDADKNNSWHPTKRYDVLVGWYEAGNPTLQTVTYSFSAQKRVADLPFPGHRAEEMLLLQVACRAGMTELSSQLAGLEVCDRQNSGKFTALRFYIPYEIVQVPAPHPNTQYWWRFSTYNGAQTSGWTGWSSFYRSF